MASTVEVAKWDQAVAGLLKHENPGVRYWTLKDVLGRSESDTEVVSALNGVASWGPVAEYLFPGRIPRLGKVVSIFCELWTGRIVLGRRQSILMRICEGGVWSGSPV